jgi:catechol 2,3-dioxygenase-like lactoylglutathione lyase family enzyme
LLQEVYYRKLEMTMTLAKLDHIAIAVPNLEQSIAIFVRTGGLRLLREGIATATGAKIAMLGDRTGMKIELIESPDANAAQFLHVAFQTDDVDASIEQAKANGWTVGRGPNEIAAAKARSAFLTDGTGFEFQLVSYAADSPDIKTW